MPRSSLPAAWMKEKAAPGDVRYYGEFCVGSVLLLGDLCGYTPSVPEQPHGSLQNPAEGRGLEPLPSPIPHPLHLCGLLKGRTELSSLLQNGAESKFCRPSTEPRGPSGIGVPMRTLQLPGVGHSSEICPFPPLTRPFPWQEVTPAWPTARWTRPAPANPSTCGSSSRSCC